MTTLNVWVLSSTLVSLLQGSRWSNFHRRSPMVEPWHAHHHRTVPHCGDTSRQVERVYDFKLQFTPDDRLQPPPGWRQIKGLRSPSHSNAPSLFDALQEQHGLKLESGKGPEEVIVVDHVGPPSEN